MAVLRLLQMLLVMQECVDMPAMKGQISNAQENYCRLAICSNMRIYTRRGEESQGRAKMRYVRHSRPYRELYQARE